MKSEYSLRKTALIAAQNAASQAQQSGNTALAQQYETQANAIKDRMDYLIGSIISDEMGNLNNQDTIRKWLGSFDRMEAEFYVARNLFNHGRPSAADSVLQLIPSKFSLNTEQAIEVAAMRQLVALLAEKDLFALNETTIIALQTNAEKEFSHSGDWARSILLNYGHWFQPIYKLPTNSERGSRGATVQFDPRVYVYPNPVTHTLNVQLQDNTGPLDLEIINAYGSIVDAKKLVSGERMVVFSMESLPNGIYLLKAKKAGAQTITQKVVVNH